MSVQADQLHMRRAIALAREHVGLTADNPSVGCVIVKDGEIIGRGRNRREEKQRTSSHAEMEAIAQANERLRSWRLDGCTLYVTLEPCPMCTGAIINSRIPCLVFGARDAVTGSCGSVIDLFFENYGHHPKVYAGVLGDESAELLRSFFKGLR